MAKRKLARLVECSGGCENGKGRAAEPGVLRDCKILGLKSVRGRRYSEEALRAAAPLYEGAPVYLDHPEEGDYGTRSVLDKFGWFENVRFVPGDGLRGDLRYNTSHQFAPVFEGWVAQAPSQIGFSHNAFTDPARNTRDPDGTAVITQIAEVASVDLVSRGATTQGLRESAMPDMDPPVIDTPDDAPAIGGGYAEHIGKLVQAIMADEGLDKAAKRKKLLKCLDLADDGDVPVVESEPEPGDDDKGKAPVKEGGYGSEEMREAARLARANPKLRPLLESHDRLATEKRLRLLEGRCRDLCVEARLPAEAITEVFVQSLMESRDDSHRRAMIEDRRAITRRGPVSHSPAGAGGKAGGKITADDILAAASAVR